VELALEGRIARARREAERRRRVAPSLVRRVRDQDGRRTRVETNPAEQGARAAVAVLLELRVEQREISGSVPLDRQHVELARDLAAAATVSVNLQPRCARLADWGAHRPE